MSREAVCEAKVQRDRYVIVSFRVGTSARIVPMSPDEAEGIEEGQVYSLAENGSVKLIKQPTTRKVK